MSKINQFIDPSEPLRLERKYWFEIDDRSSFLTKLSASSFFQPYPSRQVNSIYFDTPSLENYQQSLNGSYNRHKVRVRWYGELFQKEIPAHLEIKYKQGYVGGKKIVPIKKFSFGNKSSKTTIKNQIFPQLDTSIYNFIESLLPTVTTVYQRQYWRHYFYPLRLTIDTQLKTANHLGSPQFSRPTAPQRPVQIIELKYLPKENIEKIASQVGQFLPLQLNQFSKYSWSIEQ